MKVFISCPFSGLCNDNKYEIKDKYKTFFLNLISMIENKGHECYLAIREEQWGEYYKNPQESTMRDYNALKDSDFLIVIPGNNTSNGISGGVHIELGWASALNKKTHILVEEDFPYSPVLLGLDALTPTYYHKCNHFLDDAMLNCIENIIIEEGSKER